MSQGKRLGVAAVLVLALCLNFLAACANSLTPTPSLQSATPASLTNAGEHVNLGSLDVVMTRARVMTTDTPRPVASGSVFVDVSMEAHNGGSTAVDLGLGHLSLKDSTGRTFVTEGVSMTRSDATTRAGVGGSIGPLEPGATIRFTPRWAVPQDASGLVFLYTGPGTSGTLRFKVN